MNEIHSKSNDDVHWFEWRKSVNLINPLLFFTVNFSVILQGSSSLRDVFPQLQTLVLSNVHYSDANDLLPYFSIIPFLDKFTLYKCPLSKISTLICEHLLNSTMNNRLTSCTLHSINQKDGLVISEPLPFSYQPQHSLTFLRIDVRDLTSLKYLLIFLPNLSTLGKIDYPSLFFFLFF